MAADLTLPYGYRDARWVLLLTAFVGEFLQGGAVPAYCVILTSIVCQLTVPNAAARRPHVWLECAVCHAQGAGQL